MRVAFELTILLLITFQEVTVNSCGVNGDLKYYLKDILKEIYREQIIKSKSNDFGSSKMSKIGDDYASINETRKIKQPNETDYEDVKEIKKVLPPEKDDYEKNITKTTPNPDYDDVINEVTATPDYEIKTTLNSSDSDYENLTPRRTPRPESGEEEEIYPYEPTSFLESLWSTCGFQLFNEKETELKIITGRLAKPHSWPWIAGLYRAQFIKNEKRIVLGIQPHPFCAASLISPRYLITASHCVLNIRRNNASSIQSVPRNKWLRPETYLPTDIIVRLGDHSTLYDEVFSEDNYVKEVMHFAESKRFHLNDISLLKLAKPIKFNKGIQPVCVPPSTYILPPGAKCMAVGWGSTRKDLIIGSPVLKEDELTVLPQDMCRGFLPIIQEGHVCAGGAHKTTGKGDSGGGLYCRLSANNKQWYIFGVTSLGTPEPGPTVFASVPPHSNWIFTNVDE